ncbi:MAG TPA: saccharopine dehydrogenase NADP-binding domain-containing protein [Paracoccaceae bacterium]
MTTHPVHARIDGPLVMIGFGSIGQGTLPLIERHIDYDHDAFTVVEPNGDHAGLLAEHGIRHLRTALTRENYREVMRGLFPEGRGFCVNLSVDVGSVDMMRLCQELGVLYVDTVVEPWPGFYFGSTAANADRTNYALREAARELARQHVGGVTAVSCCGANPGMVSWLLKEALLRLADDLGRPGPAPASRRDWAALMQGLGVKGVHIAERDSQIAARPKPPGTFVNTWSVDGFLSEGYQPAELGWGSHERRLPPNGHGFGTGSRCAIWIDRPGADTRVRSWCPGVGPQFGFLVTHNEAISISDYYTLGAGAKPEYRPTCLYAYHPCNDAILSLHETNGAGRLPAKKHILTAGEIASGSDDLGVFLYGHARGGLWYGSRLSIEETRRIAPMQNATGLQVTSAVLAAMVWAVENPRAGIVEADEMDHARCLAVQRPYLGRIEAHYTDWTPLQNRINRFAEDRDESDPWQLSNFLAV